MPVISGPSGNIAAKPKAPTDSTSTFGRKLGAKPVQPKAPTVTRNPDPVNIVRTSPAPAAPAAPAAPSAADAEKAAAAEKEAVDTANAALETQIAAIEAEFGMTREQLLADEGEAGRQFRAALVGLQQQRDDNIRASMNQLVDRGVLRSGIAVSDRARIGQEFETARGLAEGDQDYALAQIAAQRAAINPQEAQAKAAATAQHEAVLRDLELMRSMAAGGVG